MEKRLRNKRKVESGRIFNAYFNAEIYPIEVEIGIPFCTDTYSKIVSAFDYNSKTYAVLGHHHFNGHFSGYKDKAAVYGLIIAEIKEEL